MGDRVKMSARMANEGLAHEVAEVARYMGFAATSKSDTVDLQFEANSDNCTLVIGLLNLNRVGEKLFSEVTLALLGRMGFVKAQVSYRQNSRKPDFPAVHVLEGQREKHEQRLKACTQPIIEYISDTFGWKSD